MSSVLYDSEWTLISILHLFPQVLDGLGLGPKGPPIPPPCTFSVVPYPKRSSEASLQHVSDCFTFLVPLSQEGEEKKEAELETELQAAVLKVTSTFHLSIIFLKCLTVALCM